LPDSANFQMDPYPEFLGLEFFCNTVYNLVLGPFLEAIVRHSSRRIGYMLAVGLVVAYGWVAMRGPQGVGALLEKRREIQELQDKNATAAREVERRRERIRRLKESQSEQDMEIRKQLKLLRPGETTFILPDAPKDDPAHSQKPESPDRPDQQ
jgi:cell division protein FtsB